jgi:CO/xanthine dehydrogenase Mo-binding subunit/aerobic-type carbon monoxide dehydrogenase small subunit (CoxS/CutS family)
MMSTPVEIDVSFTLNGEPFGASVDPRVRLSKVLREAAGLTGTKVGCDAGDCGACTVLIDGEPVCSCLTAAGRAAGTSVVTIEGLSRETQRGAALKDAFLAHGAAQCGICTPGMLVAAAALLERKDSPDEREVMDAIGGTLCRCTGYRKIVAATLAVGASASGGACEATSLPSAGRAVGSRIARLDGRPKVDGTEIFGADEVPPDCLTLRAVRSPYHHAGFTLGNVDAWSARYPGVVRVFTARDVPGANCYGVLPPFADQTVLAQGRVRFRGEAVAAIVGEPETMEALDLGAFPITWVELAAHTTMDAALEAGAERTHDHRPGNILVSGYVERGDVVAALAESDVMAEGEFETSFVEHAYIEPEAGFACRAGDRIEVRCCTQAPYLVRDDVAKILGIPPTSVRVQPTAVGGGFGSKLDMSTQPLVALAAWCLHRPVRMVYTRPESMRATTKRHPGRLRMKAAAGSDGLLTAVDFGGDFNTGAYASWGPTVANRVPVHASGPYVVPNYRARARAVHTHLVPAGAFRGFGVPQSAFAQEQIYDELALKLGIDPLEFRIHNALAAGLATVTGQVLEDGVGFKDCLEALKPHWKRAREEAEAYNATTAGPFRRGAGVAGMWYGCGNTSLPNPSTIRIGVKPDGRIALHQGAVDIGQGSNTVISQIAADALGAPIARIDLIGPDTDLTPDCGKTSASRQTFVTGKAAERAGLTLRAQILRLANAGPEARLIFGEGSIEVIDGGTVRRIDLGEVTADRKGPADDTGGYVFQAEETFDPPTTPLDTKGQGNPYAVYGFGAHLAEVEVDTDLGVVKVRRVTAAHDVGRAVNPTLVEGQIEGGIAQGIGMALMEEFHPGRGENLHDYLIPTAGDVPEIVSLLIEDPSSVGPFGAKGIGEQALIPTAPAIMNAVHHATGARLRKLPATPERVRAAIIEAKSKEAPK